MELKGTILIIEDTNQVSEKFKKREFVIETDEQYPQPIKIETTQDKTELLNGLNHGDKVNVSINIRGREWNGKYFVNIQAWRIDKIGTDPAPKTPEPVDGQNDEDLPF